MVKMIKKLSSEKLEFLYSPQTIVKKVFLLCFLIHCGHSSTQTAYYSKQTRRDVKCCEGKNLFN